MRHRFFAGAGLLVLLLSVTPAVRATTLVARDLGQLADRAQAVFTGTAVHRETVLSQDGSFPFTFVTFEVESVLKGETDPHVTLRFHGGATEKELVVVHGMPQFEVGESYLLFVRGNGAAASPVVGWIQGQFRFTKEARSGEQILVDWRGAALLGVDGEDRFELGKSQDLTDKDGRIPDMPVLLAEEGVEIEPVKTAADPQAVPAAALVLDELRSFLAGRAGKASFLPGEKVVSADPFDVPARLGGSTTTPAAQ
jgi:hypothetical protein